MKSRVLVAGGGVAALELALALRDLAAERTEVRIFAPRREFVYRPYSVGEPYGAARVSRFDLGDLARRCGASFHLESIAAVETDLRLAVTHDGERFAYDHLVLAPGAQRLWPVPGATTFWGLADEPGVHDLLGELHRGELGTLAFTTPGAETWALPLYELALLTAAELKRWPEVSVRLLVVTPEQAPLRVFGRVASDGVAGLLADRGIEILTSTRPVRFEGGRLEVVPGGHVDADAVLSLPRLEGRRIRGVPHDPDGFIRVDHHCRVLGRERLFAAGDVTAFPVKQGGLATQQADVIAAAIAAELGAPVEPAEFDPILRAELWTGRERRYLEGWPQGGHGEQSVFSERPPWGENRGKIVGRYLSEFIASVESSQLPVSR